MLTLIILQRRQRDRLTPITIILTQKDCFLMKKQSLLRLRHTFHLRRQVRIPIRHLEVYYIQLTLITLLTITRISTT